MGEPIILRLDPLSPEALARLELIGLISDPELQSQSMLGGPMTSEMEKENRKRSAKYRRRVLYIIKKHKVAYVYLEPLITEEQRLKAELARVQKEIAQLQKL